VIFGCKNMSKIILDLCGGTGAWSRPYKEAGYDVRLLTLPDFDVRDWKNSWLGKHEAEVYGILAAPPCTMFSFARTNAKKPRDLKEGMECVRACFEIIWSFMEVKQDTVKKTLSLKFWALENPYHGFLKNFLGKPAFTFDPWEFGDGYQKRTALWGYFNEPIKNPVPMIDEMKKLAKTNSYLHTMGNGTNRGKPPSIWAKKDLIKFDMLKSKDIHSEAFGVWDRQARRSITPAGFAKAFFEANQ
jgi:hypothetical protein